LRATFFWRAAWREALSFISVAEWACSAERACRRCSTSEERLARECRRLWHSEHATAVDKATAEAAEAEAATAEAATAEAAMAEAGGSAMPVAGRKADCAAGGPRGITRSPSI
jgi:hypothetical protein